MSCIEEAACLCEYPAGLSDEWTAALDGIRDDTNYEDDCDDWWDDDYGEQHVDVHRGAPNPSFAPPQDTSAIWAAPVITMGGPTHYYGRPQSLLWERPLITMAYGGAHSNEWGLP